MGHTITVRLTQDLAEWLEDTAARVGVSQGQLIREQLEKARATHPSKPFMKWAGSVRGAKNLSMRKGFSKS
jgi:hypothetical protein